MSDIARTIREREQAFEAQFKLSEEQNFKLRARHDRFFGHWVAHQMGLTGQAAEAYAIEAAQIDLEAAGDENLITKVTTDLQGAGHSFTNEDLLAALTDALLQAQQSLRDEYPDALGNDHHL
ncbi:ATPase inhibitor subunit zeta [Terasakiella pusilla]|uniref:ATPase inhibitor subunit zeta n=1 Tax=Terasakiella pusilla TaxID=64973 RepID=UPI00068E3C45|nr:ATPase inhibitor subunit zeta [Terasakiella pusilla]